MERVESEADYDESCPQSTESKRIPSATTGQGEEDAGIERCRESIIMPSRPEEVRWSVQEYSQTPLFRVPLDFMIPDVYRQQLHDESVVEDSNIPILDLACFQECTDAHVQTIRLTEHMVSRACEEYGVFQVINHGISDITLDSTLELARKFFDLPMAEKMKYKIDGVEGYGGWNSARFRDWGDNLTHVINVCKQPYASGLPDRPERYRQTIHHYAKNIMQLNIRLLRSICHVHALDFKRFQQALVTHMLDTVARSYGVAASAVEDATLDSNVVLRTSYYPPCLQPSLVLGCDPHTERGALSFVLQNDVPGLQIRRGSQWVAVKPVPNALVVFVGEALKDTAQSFAVQYKSVTLRAVVRANSARLAIVSICGSCSEDSCSVMNSCGLRCGI